MRKGIVHPPNPSAFFKVGGLLFIQKFPFFWLMIKRVSFWVVI